MRVHMKHPIHGRKVVITEEEKKHDEKNGWEEYDFDALMKDHFDKLVMGEANVVTSETKVKRVAK